MSVFAYVAGEFSIAFPWRVDGRHSGGGKHGKDSQFSIHREQQVRFHLDI